MLNPKQVKKFKDSYSDLPKNDFVDAFIIADHLRYGRINKEVYMGDYRHEALNALTRAEHQTVQSLICEKQRFLNQLFMKFSGFTQEKIFSNKSISFKGAAKANLMMLTASSQIYRRLLRIPTDCQRLLCIP